MTQTIAPKIAVIIDAEGSGTCSTCQREGLRWIAELSDGSRVGLECAKKIIGFRPAPNAYKWISDFELIASTVDGSTTYTLWKHKTRAHTRLVENGHLVQVGGALKEWVDRGYDI